MRILFKLSHRSPAKKGLIFALVLCFSLLTGTGTLWARQESSSLRVETQEKNIRIDFFYHGAELNITGEAPADSDLIITVASPPGSQSLKRKGKVGGLLWMNVGDLLFENAPGVYIQSSTNDPSRILNKEARVRNLIGYEALEQTMRISPLSGPEEKEKWFQEYVKLKEQRNLYSLSAGKIRTTPLSDGRKRFELLIPWPYQASPGDYTMTAYSVRQGSIQEKAESTIRVEQVGMVKFFASMARNRAAVYGILSVGVALIAGFAVGLIFKRGGGSK